VTQLIDLSVLERDTIKIGDGTIIELRNPEEFGVVDDYRLRTLITELADIDVEKISSETDAEAASQKLHTAAAMLAVNLPEGVDDATCAALFGVWIKKHITEVQPGPPQPNRRSRRTTARSSRGSKPSTGGARKTGSTKSRRTR